MFESNVIVSAFGFLIGFTLKVFWELAVIALRVLTKLVPWLAVWLFKVLRDQPFAILIGVLGAVTYGRQQGWEWPDNPLIPDVVVVLAGITAASLLAHRDKNKAPKHFRPGTIRKDGWEY